MRSARYTSALVLFLACCSQARSQQASQAYVNPQLGLSFRYPAAFNHESPAAVSRYEGAIFALHPLADPGHTGADPCTPVLLALGANLDRPADPPRKGHLPVVPARGTLTLSEVSRSCVDKSELDDNILKSIVSSSVSLSGMRPLGQVRNDLVGNTTVWWSASAGYNHDGKGKRSADAGTMILGMAAAVVNDHILVWSVTANEPELFNRLTNLSIATEGMSYTPLLHFQLNVPAPAEIASR